MPRLSIQDYARARGKSRTGIYKAIREGRIRESVERNDAGKLVLDAELADIELARNSDPAMLRDPDAIRAGLEANRDPTAGPLFKDEPVPAKKEPEPKSAASMAGSRAAIAAYDARLRRLDYEERIGRLISADAVKVEIFRTNRMVRDSLLTIPDRVAPVLSAETSAEKIRAILTKEITAVLRDLADEFGKRA